MPGQDAKIVLSAEDRTRAAFESAKKGLGGVGAAALSAKSALATLGLGVAGAAFVGSVRSTANYEDAMAKMARQAGETTEEFSRLAYAGRQANVDNEQLAKGLRELGNDALEGGKKLSTLGISATDASGKIKGNAQLLREFADVIAAMENPQQRAAAAAELLGDKAGPKLASLLSGGSAGLKSLADEAERFGRVVTTEAGIAAEKFNDNMTKLGEKAAGVSQVLAGPLIESLANTSSYFIKVANDAGAARAALITFGAAVARTLGVDDVGQLQSQAKANQNAIALTVKQIEVFQRYADNGVAGAAERVAKLREQYTQLQQTGAQVSQSLKGQAKAIEDEFKASAGSKLPTPDVSGLLDGKGGKGKTGLTDAQKAAAQQEKDYQSLLSTYSDAEDKHRWDMYSKRLDDQAKAEQDYADLMKRMDADTDAYRQAKFTERLEAEDKARADAIKAQADAQKEQARRLGDAFSSTFDRAFTDGMKLGDLIKKLAFDAINIQFLTPATQKLGAGLGGIVSKLFSFDGGGYTGSGSRSGGVDGKGGFPALLHPNESVIDHTRGGSGAGGGVAYVSNNNYDFRGADQSAIPRLEAMAENIKRAAVAEVFSRVNRGGSSAKVMGRSA